MKNLILLLAFIFLGSRVYADLLKEVPEYYCSDQYYECGDTTKSIVADYFKATSPVAPNAESLFVGSCYMVSESYNKNHEHYGYVYFRPQADGLGFFGGFSFFYESNPYADLNVEDASRLNSQDSKYVIVFHEQHWQTDTSQDPPWQYFFRERNGHLLLVGFWGLNDSIVCDLTRK